ncbi:uncharacterized protein [Aristolochia californica]|uniref:uncharacterized protein n=1 Tax=Aristolochia californica TaxID=171875 RepID=UPI0035DB1EBD
MAAVSEGLASNLSSSLPSLNWANHTPDSNSQSLSQSPTSLSFFTLPNTARRRSLPAGQPSLRQLGSQLAQRFQAKSTTKDASEDESCDPDEEEEEDGELRVPASPLSPPETRPRSLRLRGLAPPLGGEEKKKLEIPRLSISLSEEIEEDIWALTGSRPSRRPKKRHRNVQKKLDF